MSITSSLAKWITKTELDNLPTAVIALIQKHAIDPMAVEAIDCASTPLVMDSLSYSDPQDVNQARFSMQFCLARALLNQGSLTLADFCLERLNDSATRLIMDKIQLRLSDELAQKGFAPADGPEEANIEISMKDGQQYQNQVAFADWRPDNMPPWETLAKKFRDCGSQVMAPQRLDAVIEQIRQLEHVPKIRDVTALTST
jgi:2-methylcitrate dehydratase PrpD